MSCSYIIIFFFFQAEDGIRDLIVTGVQTCALPICLHPRPPPPRRHGEDADHDRRALAGPAHRRRGRRLVGGGADNSGSAVPPARATGDRKSTRLNSSHDQISYAVFCLKKKKQQHQDDAKPRRIGTWPKARAREYPEATQPRFVILSAVHRFLP